MLWFHIHWFVMYIIVKPRLALETSRFCKVVITRHSLWMQDMCVSMPRFYALYTTSQTTDVRMPYSNLGSGDYLWQMAPVCSRSHRIYVFTYFKDNIAKIYGTWCANMASSAFQFIAFNRWLDSHLILSQLYAWFKRVVPFHFHNYGVDHVVDWNSLRLFGHGYRMNT